jgi:hypothetical protein
VSGDGQRAAVLNALRYYWIIAKGYRLRPWASPYIQWRLETYLGKEAADLDRTKFRNLMWRERSRMWRFLEWVAEQRQRQNS